jgi:hypothetical protein
MLPSDLDFGVTTQVFPCLKKAEFHCRVDRFPFSFNVVFPSQYLQSIRFFLASSDMPLSRFDPRIHDSSFMTYRLKHFPLRTSGMRIGRDRVCEPLVRNPSFLFDFEASLWQSDMNCFSRGAKMPASLSTDWRVASAGETDEGCRRLRYYALPPWRFG